MTRGYYYYCYLLSGYLLSQIIATCGKVKDGDGCGGKGSEFVGTVVEIWNDVDGGNMRKSDFLWFLFLTCF